MQTISLIPEAVDNLRQLVNKIDGLYGCERKFNITIIKLLKKIQTSNCFHYSVHQDI